MKVHTNDRIRVMLTVPVMSVEYIPTTRILRQLQRDVFQCPWVQVDENIWTTKRLRENVAFIAKGFEVLGSLFSRHPSTRMARMGTVAGLELGKDFVQ